MDLKEQIAILQHDHHELKQTHRIQLTSEQSQSTQRETNLVNRHVEEVAEYQARVRELEQAQTQLSQRETDLVNRHADEVADYQVRVGELEARVEVLELEVTQAKTHNLTLEQDKTSLQEHVHSLEAGGNEGLKHLSEELSISQTSCSEAQTRVEALETHNLSLQQESAAQIARVEALEQQVAGLESEQTDQKADEAKRAEQTEAELNTAAARLKQISEQLQDTLVSLSLSLSLYIYSLLTLYYHLLWL